MTHAIRRDDQLEPKTVETFAEKLEAFSHTLTKRERIVLRGILVAAMDPLERAKLQKPSDLLDEGEQRTLKQLLSLAPKR